MKKKIYISGPITSLCNIDEARSRFAYAERRLMLKGYRVVNPFFNGLSEEDSWTDHMREDLKLMLDCDAIYLLRGWEYSDGAVIEKELAEKLGFEIIKQ